MSTLHCLPLIPDASREISVVISLDLPKEAETDLNPVSTGFTLSLAAKQRFHMDANVSLTKSLKKQNLMER